MQHANVLSCHRLLVIYISGLYRLLNPPASVTNCLQVRGVDIIEAYEDISSVIKDIISTIKNIEKKKKNKSTETTLKLIVLKHVTDKYLQFLSLIN